MLAIQMREEDSSEWCDWILVTYAHNEEKAYATATWIANELAKRDRVYTRLVARKDSLRGLWKEDEILWARG